MITRYRTPLFAAILAVATPTVGRAEEPLNDVFEKANHKMVKIFAAGGFARVKSSGTGMLISKEGYILTAASQLLDTSELVVHLYDGQRFKAQTIVLEPELDAAILKIRLEGKKPEDPTGLDLPYFDFA